MSAQHYAPPRHDVAEFVPTAWQSVPKLIRFVTWVYAILAVISLIGAGIFGLVFVLILGASL